MLIVSPYVKPHVEHTVYEFGSILRFIEDNWDLGYAGKERRALHEHRQRLRLSDGAAQSSRRSNAKYSRDYFLTPAALGVFRPIRNRSERR